MAGGHSAEHLRAGQIAFTQGNYDKAVNEFKKAVKDHPNSSEDWLWLGRALGRKAENSNPIRAAFMVGDIRKAFENAVQLDPKNIDARGDLIDFYLDAPAAFGGGLDKARAQADVVAKLNPADGLQVSSRIAEKQEKHDVAERNLKGAIELDPSPGRYRELASFYQRRKRYAEMEAAYRKSNDRKSHYYLAEGLVEQGVKMADADQLVRKFLEGGPVDPGDEPTIGQARQLLGQIQMRLGHREEAAREFRVALEENPNLKIARKELEQVR